MSGGQEQMDKRLLDILVCPVTKGPLLYDREQQELISVSARLAYPVRDDIPVLLEKRRADCRKRNTSATGMTHEPAFPCGDSGAECVVATAEQTVA